MTDKIQIVVQPKDVYGRKLFYPVCERAKALCYVAGKKTLQSRDIIKLSDAGFHFIADPYLSYLRNLGPECKHSLDADGDLILTADDF